MYKENNSYKIPKSVINISHFARGLGAKRFCSCFCMKSSLSFCSKLFQDT